MTASRGFLVLGCLAGVAISIYLLASDLSRGQVALLCPTTGTINCEQVTTSPESAIGPIPVAALGVAWFVITLLVTTKPQLAFGTDPRPVRAIWTGAGLAFAFYLIYSELFLIGAICLWCTAVHALVIAIFLITVYELTEPKTG